MTPRRSTLVRSAPRRPGVRRGVLATVLGLLAPVLTTGLLAPAPSQARPHHPAPFPARIALPDNFAPEGIAIGPGPRAWLGSRVDGDIYQVDLRTGEGRTISQGPGTPSIGLKSDRRGRLFVAGGPSGTARVVDARSGRLLADYQLAAGPTFVNDVVLTRRTAWFTDSQQPVLYRLPLGRGGELPSTSAVRPLRLSGDWVQVPGTNANGIATTPDGRALLVVNSTNGLLYRVDPATGDAVAVDLEGYSVVNGDGLLRVGRILYVVQNRLDQVAVLRLDRSGTRGTLVDTITSGDFDVPSTVAAFGRWLYLPSARFGRETPPVTEYWVTRVPR
ncbi:SMP-30/gluconolactonase/LRE family protein [Nocardioides houyundeii]|uniref:SMP-30/gluconolactonase/LRE family protein n=1 Tax=Nocardioides houyundeii TaxID=2045452 RepID=UPI0018F02A11|nr:superoxide dismutase [Nocardioides houyundeii]